MEYPCSLSRSLSVKTSAYCSLDLSIRVVQNQKSYYHWDMQCALSTTTACSFVYTVPESILTYPVGKLTKVSLRLRMDIEAFFIFGV